MLIAMAGLPAAGKSSIARGVGGTLSAAVVSVDPIEAALRRSIDRSQPTGLAAYLVAEAVADGILALGQTVIVDAVNAVEPARGQWRALAARHRVRLAVIEVVCSSPDLHRKRLEERDRGIEGLDEPTWADVERVRAEYEPWTDRHLVLDSVADLPANIKRALEFIAGLR
ncbi:AAA family ATPase [Actinospica sp.]|jgi:predicted kinase|uniref:AAA family ATPase n=1 Tax=Actinospica sp. TaxID=1872142 RepID=UPI002BDB0EBC|nr:AAA family ATPase [Actinospica sp.]HWG28052.1 AAA family ATPase [Actinospica sp.]